MKKHILIACQMQMASMLLATQKLDINFVCQDGGNHDERIEPVNLYEIKTFDEPSVQDVYFPEPKKGIEQKAQWANKPHKRKRS